MATRSKLAVIVHADVVGSTALVRKDEHLAHDRIQAAFQLFSEALQRYEGVVHEIRGDALVAEFSRASDAVLGALAAQQRNAESNIEITDEIVPLIRVGIALGEVIIADDTLTGAGVVLAQRLEQLAQPGGVCISAAVREAVPDRLTVDYFDLGAQEAKGFDERVVAYSVSLEPGEVLPEPTPAILETGPDKRKWRWFAAVVVGVMIVAAGFLSWLQPWQPDVERADPDKMAYALPKRPSIAVLPFDNMSTDKEQEYFADGITEDIITDLSKISGLFVVARNSTFTYKGTPIEIRKVAQDLGVRYVLEGSVRRSADKIRITAQLIDAVKGDHLWAERYDRELKDIFAVQSEVAQHVAKALDVTINSGEHERLFRKYTQSIEVYDAFIRARRSNISPSKANVARAEKLFERVIELDPKFAGGYAGLSYNFSVKARFQHGPSPESDAKRSLELATKAVAIDAQFGWAYIALGSAHLANNNPDAAVEAVREALAIQPNDYDANLFMGFYLQFAGEPALAIEYLERARRLNPVDSVRNLSFLAMAHFMNADYEKSVAFWTERLKKPVGGPLVYTYLAAAYAILERPDDAAAAVDKLREAFPDFNLSQWRYIRTYKSEENRTRLYDAAKKAGVPERPRLALPDKPSIAVLAFNNMSDDPQQEYFAEGIAEDIITELSKFHDLFVIARNSSFRFKGQSIDVREIAVDLGVRYVLEGSVRRTPEKLLINAQLIDATSGSHLWANRYDVGLNEVFSVRDDITQQIAAILAAKMRSNEHERIRRNPEGNLTAYEHVLQARYLIIRPGKKGNLEARELATAAIKIDPRYAPAYAVLSETYYRAFVTQWEPPGVLSSAFEAARKAIELDNSLAEGYDMLARVYSRQRRHGDSIAMLKKAESLNPSRAETYASLANTLTFAGRATEAVAAARKAIRLDPFHAPRVGMYLGRALYFDRQFDEALPLLETCTVLTPKRRSCYMYLAPLYAELGRIQEARETVAVLLKLAPKFTVKGSVQDHLPFVPEAMDHFVRGLRRAGVPDQ